VQLGDRMVLSPASVPAHLALGARVEGSLPFEGPAATLDAPLSGEDRSISPCHCRLWPHLSRTREAPWRDYGADSASSRPR
jgi:hypothetical protein